MRIREQANKFSGWLDVEDNRIRVFLRNASDLPIEGVNIWFWNRDLHEEATFRQAMSKWFELIACDVVAPGATYEKDITHLVPGAAHLLTMTLTYTDAQGVFWARHRGTLVDNPLRADDQPTWYQAFKFEYRTVVEAVFENLSAASMGVAGIIGSAVKQVGKMFASAIRYFDKKERK